MGRKTPAADRWGGPGASHENRDKPRPAVKRTRDADGGKDQPYSHVSGGGGEHDRHHGHSPASKRDTEENSVQKSRP
jgi:hypothetical protein